MQAVLILGVTVVGAVAYGVAHDLITAHVCVEYFSVAHPPIVRSDYPAVYAVVWGVVATWWVGLPLGIMNALACRLGAVNKWSASRYVRTLIRFLIGLLAISSTLGLIGLVMFWIGAVPMPTRYITSIPNHAGFMYDVWSHLASYGFGILGGLVVHYYIIWSRLRA